MLRILIVLAAVVWIGLLLSGAGGNRLRPGLEAARQRGEAIVEIDPLHRAEPVAPHDAPALFSIPEAAASSRPVSGATAGARAGGAEDDGTEIGTAAGGDSTDDASGLPGRGERSNPVFTLSDLPPAGQVEPIPEGPGGSDAAPGAGRQSLPGFVPLPDTLPDEADTQADGRADARVDAQGETTGPGTFTVEADALNLRDKPSTGGGVLYRLERGDRVEVIADTGTGWVEVLADDGALRGFVSARFLVAAP